MLLEESSINRRQDQGAIPNFATKKEQKRNFLDFNDVTLVVVDIKSERFAKSTCLQQALFDITMVTIMFDTKTSESESFIDRSIEGIINIIMKCHHFFNEYNGICFLCQMSGSL